MSETLFPRILILYGSETGNCEDLAKIIGWTLWKTAKVMSLDLDIEISSCNDFPISKLPDERFVLFICSTTGIGEEPLNMKNFWRALLRKSLAQDLLDQLQFAVIGLGDSSYLKYNFVAKKLFKRLSNLGAKNILELALGDDQHENGPFASIDPWLKRFYEIVFKNSSEALNAENDFDAILIEPSVEVNIISEKSTSIVNKHKTFEPYSCLSPFQAKLISNDRVTSEEHFQDVRLMTVELNRNDQVLSYDLIDVCCVYSQNSDEDTETFLNMFDSLDAQSLVFFTLKNTNWIQPNSYFHHLMQNNNPCTLQFLVKHYLDIKSIPKRSFFELFHRFSQSDLERDALKRFASGEDLDELYEYVNRPKRSILEVMLDFPHTTPNVPIEYWLDLIPCITARPYSIASSPLEHAEQLKILYAVVNYKTRLRKPRLGLCTNWLANLVPEDVLSIYIRPSTFKLPPPTAETPLIMISAGTGVAPFRAFIHDRAKRDIGNNYLFFGCRYSNKDFFLKEEWNELINQGLLQLHTAFSRDDPDKKVYVQHILWEQRELVYTQWVENDGTVLVAGKSQQYPGLVRDTLIDILKTESKQIGMQFDDEQQRNGYFEKLFNSLELKKKVQFECW